MWLVGEASHVLFGHGGLQGVAQFSAEVAIAQPSAIHANVRASSIQFTGSVQPDLTVRRPDNSSKAPFRLSLSANNTGAERNVLRFHRSLSFVCKQEAGLTAAASAPGSTTTATPAAAIALISEASDVLGEPEHASLFGGLGLFGAANLPEVV